MERKSKQFWVILDDRVEEMTGYETQHAEAWWVPKAGYTMFEGTSLFPSEAAAKSKLRSLLEASIAKSQTILARLS